MLTRILRKAERAVLGSPHPGGKISFSQCGEDLLIDYIFHLRGISKPSYIDVGAHDPYFLSNTAIFYAKGSRGINIDANPRLMERFKRHRPKDINLNLGISDTKGVLNFFAMENATLSTFSETEKNSLSRCGHKLSRIEQIPTSTLQDVLNEHNGGKSPDLLTVDVEGLDFAIIKSLNLAKSPPKVICTEAAEYSPIGAGARRPEIIDYLSCNGYLEYANTNLNAIMVLKEFWLPSAKS